MASTSRSSHRFPRRYLSPPPEVVVDGRHSPLHPIRRFVASFLHAFKLLYCDMSPLHRIVAAQLATFIAITEFVRPAHADPSLAPALRLIKLGLVVDRTSAVAVQLRKSSFPHDSLNYLCTKMPLVTGLSTELVVAVLALRSGRGRTVQRFLTGSVYVKLLAVGGLCFALNPLRSRFECVSRGHAGRTTSAWLLGVAGVLVFASPPRIDAGSNWHFQGAPLFLVIYLGVVYHYGDWDEQTVEKQEHCALEEQNRAIGSKSSSICLAVLLITLKASGIWLVRNMLASFPSANDMVPEFIVLPLAGAAIDHATDIRLALEGDIGVAWMSLVQSTFRTYFFIRPLAAFTNHDIDLAAGRIGFSVCTVATAIWLSIPGVPHFLKGMVLILTYCYLSYTCLSWPDSVFCKVI